MKTTHRKADAELRGLIRACVDEEHTLQHETRNVDDRRARVLTELANERESLIARLELLGHEKHQEHPRASFRELLREAGRTGWVLAAGVNNGDAITVCRHSRARTEASFDRALDHSWPEPIRAELTAARDRIHEESAVLNQLLF